MHKLAIVADPHYHEVFSSYAFGGVEFMGRKSAAIRTRDDSAASTRIFNESWLALPVVLDACAAQGIRTIVVAGDLTDDGQIASMDPALALLAKYEAQCGMRFFLTPGNHDVYGMSGRHHAKAFYDDRAGSIVVTSDADRLDGNNETVWDSAMFCRSYSETGTLWAPYGVKRRREDLHWESPFGINDDFDSRMFDMVSPDGSVRHRQLDLSYLVEPEPNLWLVSVDANVFEPRNGCPDNTKPDAFADSTDAGWNALVRLKPFILDWLTDVSRRAREQRKTLVCFSHYPVLDPYDDTASLEERLFGKTQAVRRTPTRETSRLIAGTGIGTHFSGHLHISDVNTLEDEDRRLTNIAIPSPVAFPPAFAVVEADAETLNIDHQAVELDKFDAFFPFYRRDNEHDPWTEAQSYGEFLYRHLRELVIQRFLPREWPVDLAQAMQSLTVQDLLELARQPPLHEAPRQVRARQVADGISGIDLVTDWYAARQAGALVTRFICDTRLALYRQLIDAYAGWDWPDPDCLQSRLKLVFEMMSRHLDDVHGPQDVGG